MLLLYIKRTDNLVSLVYDWHMKEASVHIDCQARKINDVFHNNPRDLFLASSVSYLLTSPVLCFFFSILLINFRCYSFIECVVLIFLSYILKIHIETTLIARSCSFSSDCLYLKMGSKILWVVSNLFRLFWW